MKWELKSFEKTIGMIPNHMYSNQSSTEVDWQMNFGSSWLYHNLGFAIFTLLLLTAPNSSEMGLQRIVSCRNGLIKQVDHSSLAIFEFMAMGHLYTFIIDAAWHQHVASSFDFCFWKQLSVVKQKHPFHFSSWGKAVIQILRAICSEMLSWVKSRRWDQFHFRFMSLASSFSAA